MGLITPLGLDTERTWAAVRAGESGIGPITKFDAADFTTTIAGEVRDFDPLQWVAKRELRQMDIFIQYAIASADMAIKEAGLHEDKPDPDRFGVYIGAGMGGMPILESTHGSWMEKGPRLGISPYFVPAVIINLAPGHVSMRNNARGPNLSMVSACSTGAHSLGEAARVIERGDADVMVAGGHRVHRDPAGRRWLLLRAGVVAAQRRADQGEPAVLGRIATASCCPRGRR